MMSMALFPPSPFIFPSKLKGHFSKNSKSFKAKNCF